jgi:hypothetical protein
MRMRYGVLADYHAPGQHGKHVIAGIWDTVFVVNPGGKIALPHCFLVARIDAGAIEGSEHLIEVRLVDGDGTPVIESPPKMQLRLRARGPDYPLSGTLSIELAGIELPGLGDYQFEFYKGGECFGQVDFYIVQPPDRA